ncbi:Late embryogenesis abundant protein D-7 [Spatholobus suberectus]|nr:Late embryogenesis abundant protein [Spatholobus suberectus]TKY53650.1 Late embryogenesis abundant protein D-7 [Spatholobus suberectus]
MSSAQQNFNAGQTQGQTQATAENWVQSTKDSASAASDKAQAAANTTGQTAQQSMEESAGFLQQTGEQMKNMAQGAVDSVKHTLGMDKK